MRTISSSYSRRLAGVSGTITTVCGAVTRKKLRVAPATVFSASSSVALRRSTVTGASRNCVSKIRLMPPNRAIVVNTSRLLASRKMSDAGILTFGGRSRPGGGRLRVRSMSVWSSVLPSRDTATLSRSLLRVDRSSSSIVGARGVQLGGDAVFDERLVELADGGQAARALQVILRRAHLGPFEAGSGVAVAGLEAQRLGVLDDRPVVVLTVFGIVAQARRRGRGAAGGDERHDDGAGEQVRSSAEHQ